MTVEGITARYKKATAPLDETARERLYWASAPILHGEETSELADLVKSFYEGRWDERDWVNGFGSGRRDSGETLDAALSELAADLVAERIRVEVEGEVEVVGSGKDELKMRVMGRLRDRGYDAGLCTSQAAGWSSRLPSGDHEYIDVVASDGTRYIVEINIASEFEIARPTDKYASSMRAIPKVFVATPEILRGLVDAVCVAARESMTSAGMHVPPWRTRKYMLEKWIGSYKRTVQRLR